MKLQSFETLFDMTRAADQRAIARWREAHPDRPGIWPDRADMVVLLLELLDDREAGMKLK